MPRPPDRNRLTEQEAREFRDLIRAIRAESGQTNEAIADSLEWDVRKLTNRMSNGSALLAPDALKIWKTVVGGRWIEGEFRLHPFSSALNQRITRYVSEVTWPHDGRAAGRIPHVVVPRSEVDLLAREMLQAITRASGVGESGFGPKKRALAERAIVSALKKLGPRMAQGWAQHAASQVHRFVAEHGDDWDTPLGPARKLSPQHIAREAIGLAMSLDNLGGK